MTEDINAKNWRIELDSIEELCGIEGMNSSRLLRILDRNIAADHVGGVKNELNRMAAEQLNWRQYNSGGAAFRIVAVNNRYGIIPANLSNELIVPTVADLITPDTEVIVELGCGIGRHLFALRDIVEHEYPGLRFFGCEVSETGLASGERIAALEPNRGNIAFHYFNYLEPDFDFLREFRNVVFFTCHSIEQVKHISKNLFSEMLNAASNVRCVHCEPVGWQLNDELMKTVENDQPIEVPKGSVNIFGEVSDHFSAFMPVNTGWNRNLIKVLRALDTEGLIKINFIDRNCSGNNFYNPSTLIQWEQT